MFKNAGKGPYSYKTLLKKYFLTIGSFKSFPFWMTAADLPTCSLENPDRKVNRKTIFISCRKLNIRPKVGTPWITDKIILPYCKLTNQREIIPNVKQ